ncbi:hypothetical protein LMG27177_04498 [Paraburkholderia fynbosensis]|uniref:Uncharacterized protein n=1 Tax=Paraburkholderia fynbosensis TaxID=1200993 RepID=A0A6J5GH21_9BURK|nr:hypothetical protein LMG27177_04498 [Paraburkholderia fynbosensis]
MVARIVTINASGYLIGSQEANRAPLPPKAELTWWYQFYFATERGQAGYDANRHDFNKLIWHTASPKWNFDDATLCRRDHQRDPPCMTRRRTLATGEPLRIPRAAFLYRNVSTPYSDKQACIKRLNENIPDTSARFNTYTQG